MTDDARADADHYARLQELYPEHYVAHRHGKVVASSKSFDELHDQLEAMDVNWDGLIIEYVASPDIVYIL